MRNIPIPTYSYPLKAGKYYFFNFKKVICTYITYMLNFIYYKAMKVNAPLPLVNWIIGMKYSQRSNKKCQNTMWYFLNNIDIKWPILLYFSFRAAFTKHFALCYNWECFCGVSVPSRDLHEWCEDYEEKKRPRVPWHLHWSQWLSYAMNIWTFLGITEEIIYTHIRVNQIFAECVVDPGNHNVCRAS